MDVKLTGEDILKLVNYQTKIINYNSLVNANSIEEVLIPYGSVILLYEVQPGIGHWTTVFFREGKRIEFFDPYGIKPDDERFKIPSNMWYGPFLSRLLLQAMDRGYEIEYNNYPFQEKGEGISTCGRWVGVRLRKKNLSLEEFKEIYFVPNRDELIVNLTKPIIGK